MEDYKPPETPEEASSRLQGYDIEDIKRQEDTEARSFQKKKNPKASTYVTTSLLDELMGLEGDISELKNQLSDLNLQYLDCPLNADQERSQLMKDKANWEASLNSLFERKDALRRELVKTTDTQKEKRFNFWLTIYQRWVVQIISTVFALTGMVIAISNYESIELHHIGIVMVGFGFSGLGLSVFKGSFSKQNLE